MDQQQIKVFIDVMAASDLAEMEFSQDGWTLRLARRPAGTASTPTTAAALAPRTTPLAATELPVPSTAATTRLARAPLHGVVHLSPGPGELPFATVGQAVTEGQILCVIEAMKVFNQIRAEQDASLAEVLVTSGQEVDAGQPLMRFE